MAVLTSILDGIILDLKCLEMGMVEKASLTRGPNNLLDV